MKHSLYLSLASGIAVLALGTPALAAKSSFTVIYGGVNIGHLIADTQGDTTTVMAAGTAAGPSGPRTTSVT